MPCDTGLCDTDLCTDDLCPKGLDIAEHLPSPRIKEREAIQRGAEQYAIGRKFVTLCKQMSAPSQFITTYLENRHPHNSLK